MHDWFLPATTAELFLILFLAACAVSGRQESELASARGSVDSAKAAEELLRGREAGLAQALAQAQRDLDDSKRKIATLDAANRANGAKLDGERRLRAELLDLAGDFGSVAFVLDASESMAENSRWERTTAIVERWMTHLPAEKLLLIVFNSYIECVPADGSMAAASDPALRAQVRQRLREIRPQFQTNTLRALELAYAANPDTIVLFSDGRPGGSNNPRDNAAMEQAVKELVMAHRDIPINVVAVGTYFWAETSAFLFWLADATGGTFLGR